MEPATSLDQNTGLQRGLKARHLRLIALGGVIGAGLFVGSGVVVQSAGPAAVLSFALTGAIVVLVMRMLGEMAVAYPAVGGFYEYNRLALGDLAGFLTGWMYWYFWVIVVALEAVAGAKLIDYWIPGIEPWVVTLALTALFMFLNLLSVRVWGETEFWFASIKIAAIVVFLVAGAAWVLGLWPGGGGFSNLTANGGFAPNGIGPVLTGAVAATGFYFGAELVTVAAAESTEPERAVARSMQSVISRVLIFYVGSIFLVVCILPWNDAELMSQPYVSAFEKLGLPGAAQVMNAVILTAVLSALNSGLFASSRMLMAMSRRGDAPRTFSRVDRRGIPVPALLAGTVFAYVTVVMSYVSPDKVFAFLVNSYGTVAIFVYVLIAFAQLRLRKRLEAEAPERLRLKMWGYPYLSWVAILAMLAIVAAMAFIPDQRAPLLFGVLSTLAMLAGYVLSRRRARGDEGRGSP